MATRAACRWLGFATAGVTFVTAAGQDLAQCAGTWTQVASGDPGVRYDGAMVYDSLRDQYILFGGYDGAQITGSTQIFNPTTRQWSEVVPPLSPPGRLYHNMVYDKIRDRVVLYGGYNGDILGDTWEYNPGRGTWKQRLISGAPYHRFLAAMAYDSARGVTVLYGGTTGVGTDRQNNETWEWNGITWSLRTTDGPEARNSHAMAFDSRRGVTVLHGGSASPGGFLNDTWEWDGAVWSKRPLAGAVPEGVRYHSMVYDSARGVTVLTGKETDSAEPMTIYEWNGSEWRLGAMDGPASRCLTQVIFDQARARTVLYGGYTSSGLYFDDMWEWAGPAGGDILQFASQPAPITTCLGGTATFEVELTGQGPFQYQWRRNGVPMPGRTSNQLTITPVSTADRARYDCLVSNSCGSISSLDALLSTCAIDLNCDGFVDFGDVLEFFRLYDAGDLRVDFNADGLVDFTDYLECLNLYDAGC